MSTYNDALLALGQYAYANSAFIRCDHPHPALREQINEHLIGLVDAVDSAEFGGDGDGRHDCNWNKAELWTRRTDRFCVEVRRHTEPPCAYTNTGPNRWFVYAYIYQTHAHFAKFDGSDMWQGASIALPLHGGPSMLRWHYDANGDPTSVQVGADYNHLGDERYTFFDNAEQAFQVFRDASDLYEWLSSHMYAVDSVEMEDESDE